MTSCVRDFNTGFICFDKRNNNQFPENFDNLLDCLLKNNPLYAIIEELNTNNIKLTLKLTNKVGASCGIVLETECEVSKTPGSKKKDIDIYVGVSLKDDGNTIQLPFKIAIASLFPFLFPNGPSKVY